MFIVIDGIDASGKATQVGLLQKKLQNMGKKVRILDYPRYSGESAFFVEKYLNGDYGKNISAKQASIFYAIDRFDDSFGLKIDLENYDYIISNRYVSASMIHQAGKIKNKKEREDFLDWLDDLEYNIFSIPRPDKTIFLNVSPLMSQKLVLRKEKRNYLKGDKKMDIHEENKNHLQNSWELAMELVKKYNWIKIDCEMGENMRSIEDINKEVFMEILKEY